jgi:hypothetical protein
MPNTDTCASLPSKERQHTRTNQYLGSSQQRSRCEIHCLLQLLRTLVSGDLSCRPSIQQDWRPFATACDSHQIAPFVFCRLRDLVGDSVPSGLLEHLRARFYEISANNYRLAKELVDLTSLLQSHGVPVLAYKGPALAMALYGDLALRQYCDLDLVVRKEHLLKAVGVMSHCGFEIVPTLGRPQMLPYLCRSENPRHLARAEEMTFRAPDKTYFVDVHWQLGHGPWRAFSPDAEKIWERTEKLDLPQGSVSTFCDEDLFLALCYHGSKHRWSCLKWLLDVAELLRKAETLDWFRIAEMMRVRPRTRASASLAILLAQELLNAPVPAEAARIVPATQRTLDEAAAIREEILLRGQTSGNDFPTLLALEERPLARMKYRTARAARYPGGLFSEVVLQVSPKDRAFIRLPEKLRFLYHVIRPARLVVKHGRRAFRSLWSVIGANKFFEQRRA